MTTINSICVKCKNLDAYTCGACIGSNGVRSLISTCKYGGRNAGNRKTCRDFEETTKDVIARRIECLKED